MYRLCSLKTIQYIEGKDADVILEPCQTCRVNAGKLFCNVIRQTPDNAGDPADTELDMFILSKHPTVVVKCLTLCFHMGLLPDT